MCRDENADLVDEHYYVNHTFLLNNTHRYDSYPREGPHVFVGEYAARASSRHYNNFFSALSEAAYVTGLERNSDVVEMASYAPLLAKRGLRQLVARPDLVRQLSRVRHAQLLGPTAIRAEPRRHAGAHDTRAPAAGAGRAGRPRAWPVRQRAAAERPQPLRPVAGGDCERPARLHDLGVGEPADGRRVGARVRLRLGPGREHVPDSQRGRREPPRFAITTSGNGNEQQLPRRRRCRRTSGRTSPSPCRGRRARCM